MRERKRREGRVLTGTPLYPNCLKSRILSGIRLGVDEQPVPYTSAAAAPCHQQLLGDRDPGAIPGGRRTARAGLGFAADLHAARWPSQRPLQARMQEKGWGRRRGQDCDWRKLVGAGRGAGRGRPAARAAPSGVRRPFLSGERVGGDSRDL